MGRATVAALGPRTLTVTMDKRLPAQYAGHLLSSFQAPSRQTQQGAAQHHGEPQRFSGKVAAARQPLAAIQQRQGQHQGTGSRDGAAAEMLPPQALVWRLDKDDVASVFVKLRAHLMGAEPCAAMP